MPIDFGTVLVNHGGVPQPKHLYYSGKLWHGLLSSSTIRAMTGSLTRHLLIIKTERDERRNTTFPTVGQGIYHLLEGEEAGLG